VQQPTYSIYVYVHELFVYKFVFYVVLFELTVKKFTNMSFVTIIGSYRSSDAIRTQSARFVLCELGVTCKMWVLACGLR